MNPLQILLLLIIIIPNKTLAVSLEELVNKVDTLYRHDFSQARIKMTIVNPDWQRTLVLDSWSEGMDKTLIKILKPKKEAGIGTLKLGQQMWNHFPKINRTIKVPPSMMMGAWMGSDLTNDDLVRSESLADDYISELKEQPERYIITLVPKLETITVWGKIEVEVDRESLLPVVQRFYNERNKLMRTMSFSKVRNVNGLSIPTQMELIPVNKPGHLTRIEYETLSFPDNLPANTFSLQQLKRKN